MEPWGASTPTCDPGVRNQVSQKIDKTREELYNVVHPVNVFSLV
jgi:hypothetical protein